MITDWNKTRPIKNSVIMGAVIRIVLILILSQYQNILKQQLSVTDIDYKVYTDAAMRDSPYDRHTYRYTPLLAYLMHFNYLCQWAGKIIFVGFDILAMLALGKMIKPQYRNTIINLYAFNPLFIELTVRGSCQSITMALMFWSLYFIFGINGNVNLKMDAKIEPGARKYAYVGYMLYGLWVHFRIYPIFFLPILLIHEHKLCSKTKQSFLVKFIEMGVFSGGVFLALLGVFYYLYGFPFLQETYLYHLTRLDNRHSFSPYFYEIYLSLNTPNSLRSLAQFAVFFSASKQVHNKISPFYGIFLISYAFVSFNKVITMQYYIWVWGALLILLPESNLMTNSNRRFQKSFNYTIQWVLGIMLWVWLSNKLEGNGENVFFGMWFVCIAKLFLDLWVVLGFLGTIKNIITYQPLKSA